VIYDAMTTSLMRHSWTRFWPSAYQEVNHWRGRVANPFVQSHWCKYGWMADDLVSSSGLGTPMFQDLPSQPRS
jgi:hypothetical protein